MPVRQNSKFLITVTRRGRRIFIIGSTFPNADNLMEMLLMLDAAKRASARHITAVLPYFGWARQDRKDKPRVAIGAKLIAKLLEEAGATRGASFQVHDRVPAATLSNCNFSYFSGRH